jgi:hypothetical protein
MMCVTDLLHSWNMALDGSAPGLGAHGATNRVKGLTSVSSRRRILLQWPMVDRPARACAPRACALENNYANHAKLLSFESMQICKPRTYINTSMRGSHTPPATAPPAGVLGSPGYFQGTSALKK